MKWREEWIPIDDSILELDEYIVLCPFGSCGELCSLNANSISGGRYKNLDNHLRRKHTVGEWRRITEEKTQESDSLLISSPKQIFVDDDMSTDDGTREQQRSDASTQIDIADEFRLSWLSRRRTLLETCPVIKPIAAIKPRVEATFRHNARQPSEEGDFVVLDVKFFTENRRDENGEPLVEVLWKDGWVITLNPLSLMENSRELMRERFEEDIQHQDIANADIICRFIYSS